MLLASDSKYDYRSLPGSPSSSIELPKLTTYSTDSGASIELPSRCLTVPSGVSKIINSIWANFSPSDSRKPRDQNVWHLDPPREHLGRSACSYEKKGRDDPSELCSERLPPRLCHDVKRRYQLRSVVGRRNPTMGKLCKCAEEAAKSLDPSEILYIHSRTSQFSHLEVCKPICIYLSNRQFPWLWPHNLISSLSGPIRTSLSCPWNFCARNLRLRCMTTCYNALTKRCSSSYEGSRHSRVSNFTSSSGTTVALCFNIRRPSGPR